MSGSMSIGEEVAGGGTSSVGSFVEASSDVVDDTRRFFTANLVRRIALHRRLSCDAVEQAIGLALPALLEALADLASRPLGAGILACSVARQYPATPETIRNGIGSESQDVAAAYGSGYMAYLVGEPAFARTCADIAWASGLDERETKLLVGLVGWILMSRLRLEQRRRYLSPAGLAHLLRGSCSRPPEGVGGTTVRRTARAATEVPSHVR
jgi:hypothetical protein